MTYPSYLEAFKSGRLKEITEKLFSSLDSCQICPRRCQVNRLEGKLGFCKTASLPEVYSYMCHHGEEPPVSGKNGSGTIFFSHCNMGCIYCQNYEFSQLGKGKKYTFEDLAGIMLKLQEEGCHNINLVTPTHVLPQILKSLEIAVEKGLKIPLVYNTSGYELAEIIKLLDGIVDIYLSDSRYGNDESAVQFSLAPGYVRFNQDAMIEMHRQVGIAEFTAGGLIKKGLIVRHLVLPNKLSATEKIMKFIAQELTDQTYISLMSQYLPYHKASLNDKINRRISPEEYAEAKKILEQNGLFNGWIQESYGQERFAGVNLKPVK